MVIRHFCHVNRTILEGETKKNYCKKVIQKFWWSTPADLGSRRLVDGRWIERRRK